MNVELLDKAVAGALCPTFQALVAGSSFVQVVGPFTGPAGKAASLTAIPVTALSMLGAAATCGEVDIGPDPYDGLTEGCTQTDKPSLLNATRTDGTSQSLTIATDAVQIISVEMAPDTFGYDNWLVTYKLEDGQIRSGYGIRGTLGGPPAPQRIELIPQNGAVCQSDTPVLPPFDNPTVPDHTYVDESTNCTYIVKFEGLVRQVDGGPISPVYQISAPSTRSDGGRMGGCNFSPVIYTPGPNGPGGPGGPPIPPIPVPPGPLPGPDDGVPWWAWPLLAGATSAALTLVGQKLDEILGPTLEEGSFTLTAPCNKDAEGNPLTQTWEFPTQSVEERQLAHQITMLEALQTHLNWKTPICDETTIPEGDFRTISFRSDEVSPYGKSRLRKRFRYRSVSGNDLGAVVDHWKDFTFEGGPYRVRWIGGTWGSPEVWAASEAEGKRVIQHAAAEAGFDPFENGRWSTRVSSSTRRGVPGTMRIDTTKGFYWITARDGSDQRPIVALT